ncbi:unnamed protein product, partial [Gulo gulo]
GFLESLRAGEEKRKVSMLKFPLSNLGEAGEAVLQKRRGNGRGVFVLFLACWWSGGEGVWSHNQQVGSRDSEREPACQF